MSKRKIGEASLILAGSTLVTNLLQILKLVLVSAWFGASTGILDKYFVGLNVPLAFQGVILGAVSSAFIPVYVGMRSRGQHVEANRLLTGTLGMGLTVFSVIILLLFVGARPVILLAAGGLDPVTLEESVQVFRILLLTLFAGGMADLLTYVFNAHQRYFFPALAPVVGILVSTIYLIVFRSQGVYALVYGHVLGTVSQLLLVAWGSWRYGQFKLSFSFDFLRREFRPVYAMMLPMGLTLFLAHANILVDQAVASYLVEGSISILNYATRMHDVVVKLFVMNVGGALLPFLSQYVAEGRFSEIKSTMSLGNRLSFIVLGPTAVAIYFFGIQAVAIVFQRNMFTGEDSRLVGLTWAAYAVGCFFMASTVLSVRALTALQDLRPLIVAHVMAIPLNIVLDLVLAHFLGVPGIALATPLVYLFFMCYFRVKLRQRLAVAGESEPTPEGTKLWRYAFSLGAFIIIAGCVDRLLGGLTILPVAPSTGDRMLAFFWLSISAASCVLAYIVVLKIMRVRELAAVLSLVSRVTGLGRKSSAEPGSLRETR